MASGYTFNNTTIDAMDAYFTHYWAMEETSGNRADLLNGNALTDHNTVGYNTGIQGNAADFETTGTPNEYFTLSTVCKNRSVVLLNAWVYPESFSALGCIFVETIAASLSTRAGLYIDSTGKPYMYARFDDSTLRTGTGSGTITAGSWYCVTAIFDSVSDYMRCRINGTTYINQSTTVNAFLNTDPQLVGIGGSTGAGQYWDGRIDAFGIWLDGVPDSFDNFADAQYNAGVGRFPVPPGVQLGPFAAQAWGNPYSQGAWR